MKKYVEKNPVVRTVEAVQFDNSAASRQELSELCGHWVSLGAFVYVTSPIGAVQVKPGDYVVKCRDSYFCIMTKEEFENHYE